MSPEEMPLLATEKFSKEPRLLPKCLLAVFWILGLIEWSEPFESDSSGDGHPILITVRGKWKRRFLCLTSRLCLTILVGVNLYCGYSYVRRFFGVANNFYHFASFLLTYWPLMISVQLICLFSSVCRWLHSGDYTPIDGQWWTVFSESSVLKRLQPFHVRRYIPPETGYLVAFALLALGNNALVIGNFCLNDRPEVHDQSVLWYVSHVMELATTVLSMSFYAIFCYFLYLQRITLELHCSRVVWHIKRNAGAIGECQVRLNEFFKEYLSVRRLVHPWITLVISATTFGLAVHVAWNYKAIGEGMDHEPSWPRPTLTPFTKNQTDVNVTSSKSINFYFLDSLIFINKVTVVAMALLAVGGTDISRIWKRFVFAVHVMRSSKHERFWSKIVKLIRELNMGTTADMVIDILLPVLLLALGILGVDKFDF